MQTVLPLMCPFCSIELSSPFPTQSIMIITNARSILSHALKIDFLFFFFFFCFFGFKNLSFHIFFYHLHVRFEFFIFAECEKENFCPARDKNLHFLSTPQERGVCFFCSHATFLDIKNEYPTL